RHTCAWTSTSISVPPVTSATGSSIRGCRLRQDNGYSAPRPVAAGGKSAPPRGLPRRIPGGEPCCRICRSECVSKKHRASRQRLENPQDFIVNPPANRVIKGLEARNSHKKRTPMKVELRPIAGVRPYDKNPRLNEAAVDAVAASIHEFGFRQP